MAIQQYKNDERRLIYWIIHTSNSVKASRPGAAKAPPPSTGTGKITLSGLISLSRLIAQHVRRIPPGVFRLFRSIIAARSAMHAYFERIADGSSDPRLARSNRSHAVWIEGLVEAFRALGGEAWEAERTMRKGNGKGGRKNAGVTFSNRFAVLSLDDGESDGDNHASAMASRMRQDVVSHQMVEECKRRESTRSAANHVLDALPIEHSHGAYDGGGGFGHVDTPSEESIEWFVLWDE